MSVSTASRWARQRAGLPTTNSELFSHIMEMSPLGIKSYEMCIYLGYNLRDWSSIRKLAKEYNKSSSPVKKVKVMPRGDYLFLIRADYQERYLRYYRNMKALISEATDDGELPLPKKMNESLQDYYKLRTERALQRRKEKQEQKAREEVELREAYAHKVRTICNQLSPTWSAKELATLMQITVPGAKSHIKRWLENQLITQIAKTTTGGRGMKNTYKLIN